MRPIASASCDLDRRLIAGLTPFKPPFALGHECVAEVLEVGAQVGTVKRGDLVSVPWKIACGTCRQCLAGRSTACTGVARHAAYGVPAGGHWGGLFSEVVRVPFADAMLVPLPRGWTRWPWPAPATTSPMPGWLPAARWPREEAKVLVVGGTESLGILAVQMARAAGAAEVDYLDGDGYRDELAVRSGATLRNGADGALNERYDLVVSATRDPQALRTGLLALAPGGHCSCIGIIFEDPAIPLFGMYMRDVTLSVGACSVRPHIPRVLELVEQGHCDPMLVSPSVVPWEEATEALIRPLAKCIVVRERITTAG